MTDASNANGRTFLFVYGTLKRDFPNCDEVPTSVLYLGTARTTKPYPLVVGTEMNIPFMLKLPAHSNAHKVHGELYSGTDKEVDVLDQFEGVPTQFYRRETIEIVVTSVPSDLSLVPDLISGEKITQGTVLFATCYFRGEYGPEWALKWSVDRLQSLPMIAEYSQEHAQHYIPRDKRPSATFQGREE